MELGECMVGYAYSLGKPLGLAGGGENGTPPAARRVEAFGVGCEHFDRHVNETLVQKTDDHAGLAGHGRVDGVARKEIAEERVLGVRRAAANLVPETACRTSHDNPVSSRPEQNAFCGWGCMGPAQSGFAAAERSGTCDTEFTEAQSESTEQNPFTLCSQVCPPRPLWLNSDPLVAALPRRVQIFPGCPLRKSPASRIRA